MIRKIKNWFYFKRYRLSKIFSILKWLRPKGIIKVPGAAFYPNDFIGKIPARTEVTVLSPDDPSKLKLGWVIEEDIGSSYSNKRN